MSNQAVFNPKFQIVGVDPDKNEVVKIPGTEFQAPVTTDLSEFFTVKIEKYDKGDDKYQFFVYFGRKDFYGTPSVSNIKWRIKNSNVVYKEYMDFSGYTLCADSEWQDYLDYANWTSEVSGHLWNHHGELKFEFDHESGIDNGADEDYCEFLLFEIEILATPFATHTYQTYNDDEWLQLETRAIGSVYTWPVLIDLNWRYAYRSARNNEEDVAEMGELESTE